MNELEKEAAGAVSWGRFHQLWGLAKEREDYRKHWWNARGEVLRAFQAETMARAAGPQPGELARAKLPSPKVQIARIFLAIMAHDQQAIAVELRALAEKYSPEELARHLDGANFGPFAPLLEAQARQIVADELKSDAPG